MQGAAARLGDTVPVLGGFPDVVTVALKKIGIRYTFWFNAGSRIIENRFMGYFFLFIAPVRGYNPAGYFSFPFQPCKAKQTFN